MRYKVPAALIIISLLLSGCGFVELTDEESDIIAEYAAAKLLEDSYYYQSKYIENETTTAEPETTAVQEPETTEGEAEPETTEEVSPYLNSLFSIKGVDVAFKGYKVTDEYPDDEDALFSFEPEAGHDFLVAEFSLINNGAEDVTVNTIDSEEIYRITVNTSYKCNNYATLLLNDITRLDNVTIKAGESYDAVLVFMITNDASSKMTTAVISSALGTSAETLKIL